MVQSLGHTRSACVCSGVRASCPYKLRASGLNQGFREVASAGVVCGRVSILRRFSVQPETAYRHTCNPKAYRYSVRVSAGLHWPAHAQEANTSGCSAHPGQYIS